MILIIIFLNIILKDFIQKHLKEKLNDFKNENKKKNSSNKSKSIKIKFNLKKELIGTNVYFLNNSSDFKNEELNGDNIEIEINGIKTDFCNSFIPKISKNEVVIKFKNNIKNFSYMFYGCDKIDEIDFSEFKMKTIINMENMFSLCYNLKNIDLSPMNTRDVENMKNMFFKCINLEYIKVKDFGKSKITKMKDIFLGCEKFYVLDLTSYDQFCNFDVTHILKHTDKLKKIIVKKEFRKRFKFNCFVKDKSQNKNIRKKFEEIVVEI